MDDDQQFCLRWNNHQSTLIAVFDTLLENGTLVDCTLAAEGKFLHAHKVVLSACSPYFESLLSQNYDKHPIFILKDIKYQELKAMMDYMYRGEVNISQDQLGALLKAAESLQIKGLSDNRKGETEPKKSQPLPPKSPPPAPSLPKVQGLTIEHKRREMDDSSRDGSQSPGLRRKKRVRRRSVDEIENHHEASNSSESHHSTPAQNIPSLPATKITDVPEPSTDSKQDLRQRSEESEAQVPNPIKEKLETHSELMLEPKSEYADDTNEENIEDLTLDDEDLSNMEQMDEGAGPSHGNMGEGSGQGFGWHMGNQSQDEVFLAAQEAVGAHRDSQGSTSTEIVGTVQFENIKISQYHCACGEKFQNGDQYTLHQEVECIKGKKKRGRSDCRMCSSSSLKENKDGFLKFLVCACDRKLHFKCPYCPHRCSQEIYLRLHLRKIHRFVVSGLVNLHKNIERFQPFFQCYKCERLIKQYCNYARHVNDCKLPV